MYVAALLMDIHIRFYIRNLRDKKMADKLMYIPNNDIQSDPLSKVETLKYST